ncbi:MAG: N-formylglutamate amidohydrolase [Deltaproteobacteria bacterium]|nr:N-formylglutamate amidohydrolase [Deltaproteobacteria bacterium]NND30382.1 N-formylglutamate amidohydrolase [Myxococcales bacterium]MBT8466886.1 N-formylglutamate amidohydrolase [Deltaproteobacteria bacterium]MBT8480732.1 N-formylglutamate amidohydrolase [Deltaproteobacteria bacterium]NNK05984.1 N-formylglutamate amidohydrolase [Myxococcales bacterium]
MSYVELTHPHTTPTPVLVEVPHSGLQVPPEVESEIQSTPLAVLRDSDIYVDQLYQHAPQTGATLLVARVSRYVVDLNRGPDDVDSAAVPRHPRGRRIPARGVVWRARTDGTPLLRAPLSVEQFSRRLELFYHPYHRALRDAAAQIHQEQGRVLILAAHSMPSSGRRTVGGGKVRRADVVPGTRGRSTADGRIIDLIDSHFRQAGLSVKHDDPYRGGWTTSSYGTPKRGQHAVQIELNRALYVDERTSEIKKDDFAQLRVVLEQLVEKLGTLMTSSGQFATG